MRVRLVVNGRPVEAEVEPRVSLADFLRGALGLTATHLGCEHGVCGACTVLLDGSAARSCLVFAVQASGSIVVTLEGLHASGEIAALQEAFRARHALQCGFCTPGVLVAARALLAEVPSPTREQVREALSGNLCRCTGYVPIVEAVLDAAAAGAWPSMRGDGSGPGGGGA